MQEDAIDKIKDDVISAKRIRHYRNKKKMMNLENRKKKEYIKGK